MNLKHELGITLALFADDRAQQPLDYNNIIALCLVLFGLITNSSFLLTVLKVPSLHTITYILLSCLACSDLTILITHLVSIWIKKLTNFSAFVVNSCFHTFCCLSSTGFVLLVSIERYRVVFSVYTWYSYYMTSLNLFIVMLYILASCFYMYANILVAFAKRKRNTDLQMSTEFKNKLNKFPSWSSLTEGCISY